MNVEPLRKLPSASEIYPGMHIPSILLALFIISEMFSSHIHILRSEKQITPIRNLFFQNIRNRTKSKEEGEEEDYLALLMEAKSGKFLQA